MTTKVQCGWQIGARKEGQCEREGIHLQEVFIERNPLTVEKNRYLCDRHFDELKFIQEKHEKNKPVR